VNGGAGERERFAGAAPWTGLALVSVPFLVSIVVLLSIGGRFHAVSDQALEEMLTRDVGHHAVLLGPFARDDWSHLGPAMFYALAVPYRLTGSNSVGMWIGAVAINAAAVAVMALIARRHGGTALMMLTLLGCAALMRALGADFLRNPWNPYLPVFLFGALIFLVWAMACGDTWALPVGAGVATFCAQTHIEYVILALPLFVAGTIWFVCLALRRHEHGNVHSPSRRSLVRAGMLGIGVLVVMWLPPIIDELTHSPGNLTRVLRYFRDPPPGPRHSVFQGYRVVAGQFWAIPEWVRGAAKPDAFSGEPTLLNKSPVPLLFAGFVAGSVVLWRRRRDGRGDERGWRLAAIVGGALVLGILAVARTVGPAFEYCLRWSLLVAMIATIIAVWGAWTIIQQHISMVVRRRLMLVSLLLLGVLTTADAVAAIRAGTPQQPQSGMVSRLAASTLDALPPGAGDVVVESPDPILGNKAGIVLWLEHHGVAARVEPGDELGYGGHRVLRDQPIRAVVTVASDSNADDVAVRPDQRLIAASGEFSEPARQKLIAQKQTLERAYNAHQLSLSEYLRRTAALLGRLGHVTAVFLQVPDG